MSSAEDILAKQQQVAAAEEKRLSILGLNTQFKISKYISNKYLTTWTTDQILESGAKDRLARLALVRKEKARSVEDTLIAAATNGKLPGKVVLIFSCHTMRYISINLGNRSSAHRAIGTA